MVATGDFLGKLNLELNDKCHDVPIDFLILAIFFSGR